MAEQSAAPLSPELNLTSLPNMDSDDNDEVHVKDEMEALRQENTDYRIRERTYTLLSEISLKAVALNVYYSTQMPFNVRLPSLTLQRLLFDQHGTINPSHFATLNARILLIQSTFHTLFHYHHDTLLAVGWQTGAFLVYITAFLPQLQFLAETALGDQPHAQLRGWETAWTLLFSALWLGIDPLHPTLPNPHPQVPWVDPTRELRAMLELDRFLCKMARKRIAFVEETYDENGLHAKYWAVNVEWMLDALKELNVIACSLSNSSGRDYDFYFRNFRRQANNAMDIVHEAGEEAMKKPKAENMD